MFTSFITQILIDSLQWRDNFFLLTGHFKEASQPLKIADLPF